MFLISKVTENKSWTWQKYFDLDTNTDGKILIEIIIVYFLLKLNACKFEMLL